MIGIDDQCDVDLMDMTKFTIYNPTCNFIMVAIDIFSKYAWLRPLKEMRGESVKKALKNIFAEGRSPSRIRTDKGQEFRSRLVESTLKHRRIEHMIAQNTEYRN